MSTLNKPVTTPEDTLFAKDFVVAAVSQNTNAFGLNGMVLVGQDGEAFEVAVYNRLTVEPAYQPGQKVRLVGDRTKPHNESRYTFCDTNLGRTFELPRLLPPCPPAAVAKLWAEKPLIQTP